MESNAAYSLPQPALAAVLAHLGKARWVAAPAVNPGRPHVQLVMGGNLAGEPPKRPSSTSLSHALDCLAAGLLMAVLGEQVAGLKLFCSACDSIWPPPGARQMADRLASQGWVLKEEAQPAASSTIHSSNSNSRDSSSSSRITSTSGSSSGGASGAPPPAGAGMAAELAALLSRLRPDLPPAHLLHSCLLIRCSLRALANLSDPNMSSPASQARVKEGLADSQRLLDSCPAGSVYARLDAAQLLEYREWRNPLPYSTEEAFLEESVELAKSQKW